MPECIDLHIQMTKHDYIVMQTGEAETKAFYLLAPVPECLRHSIKKTKAMGYGRSSSKGGRTSLLPLPLLPPADLGLVGGAGFFLQVGFLAQLRRWLTYCQYQPFS